MTGAIALRRFWWVVVLFVLLGTLGAFGASALTTKLYTSQSKLLLTPVSASSSTDFSATSYVAARGLAYANVAASRAFLQQVQSKVGAPLGSQYPVITVDLVTGTTLLNITAQDTTAQGALTSARVVDTLLVQQSRTLDISATGSAQVRINVVADAILPSSPSSTGRTSYFIGGALLGIVLGAAFAVALARVSDASSRTPVDQDGASENFDASNDVSTARGTPPRLGVPDDGEHDDVGVMVNHSETGSEDLPSHKRVPVIGSGTRDVR